MAGILQTIITVILTSSLLSSVAIAGPGSKVEIWTRSAGNYQDKSPSKSNLKVVDLTGLKGVRKKLIDIQYDKSEEYEGVTLNKLLDMYPSPKGDLVILHFSNSTLIPVPLADLKKRFGNTVFIATKIKNGKKWVSNFPPSKLMHHMYLSPLPVTFANNKIVLSSGVHPYIEWSGEKDFSPWQFVGSLTGIEFVDREAYENQFMTKSSSQSLNGQEVFLKRCQYCHGVDNLGAQFGWNVNGVIPLYKKRDAGILYIHVKYPKLKGNYFDSGMPNQRSFTEEEAKNLWIWFKDAATMKMKPYKPS